MKSTFLRLCALSIFLVAAALSAGENESGGSNAAEKPGQEPARPTASGNSGRQQRSTNTEKTDRSYKDEEILNAPPPPNRVRIKPAGRVQ